MVGFAMRTTKPHVKRWNWGGPDTKWVVDGLRDEDGKRKRKFFPSRDAANEWLARRRPEMQSQGRAAMAMSDRQRVDAVRAIAILEPFGTTLTAAAEAFAERAQLLSRTVTFEALRTEVVAVKKADRKSPRYVLDVKNRLERVGELFDDRMVAAIEPRELDDWLRGLKLSPVSRANFRKVLRTTFEYGVSRGYCRENPVLRTAEVKTDVAVPGILTPTEIAALLRAADPRIVPAIAIGAFAGLRDAEIGRLTWDRIDFASGYIKLDAAIAKTSSRRLVPIADNLRAWLTPYAQKSGAVRGAVNDDEDATNESGNAGQRLADPALGLVGRHDHRDVDGRERVVEWRGHARKAVAPARQSRKSPRRAEAPRREVRKPVPVPGFRLSRV